MPHRWAGVVLSHFEKAFEVLNINELQAAGLPIEKPIIENNTPFSV